MSAKKETEKMMKFILKEFPEEPGKGGNETPVDVAIRLLNSYKNLVRSANQFVKEVLNIK